MMRIPTSPTTCSKLLWTMSTPMQATSSGASGAASAGKRLGSSNLARPLPYGKTIGISSFAFLFAEMVAYYRGRVSALSDLEAK